MASPETQLQTAAPSRAESGIDYQIPRNSLALLMVAQAVVILPFLQQLSPGIIAVGLFCGYWRTGVYQGRWDYPKRWVKLLLVVASVAGVALSGVGSFSLEAAASLLILAFALKLIEMKSRRDAYLVIFLGYFIIATQFLFEQSIAIAAYQLGAAIVVTAAMVGMNQLISRVRPLGSLRLAGSLVLQALPFTIVLFLFFPRIAPLWTVPLPGASKTGLSDRMTPGDVAQLTRSDELAFRVVFDGSVPAGRDLYWRGLVYSSFVAGTWTVGRSLPDWSAEPLPPEDADAISYEVLLEPTQREWLFALETPQSRSPAAYLTRDYLLQSRDPVLSVFRYQARSFSGWNMDPELSDSLRQRETWLPRADNPRIRAFAAQQFATSGSVEGFVGSVLARIRDQDFFYTLSPPQLPRENSIDEFWFNTRRGFCTHYAGALVFMLRSVGVPARMVGGYQGGEVNPISGHVIVRQYDAHAWVEYWLPGTGWQRVDPTFAVAPARIEEGLSAALSAEDRASLSAFTSARFGGWVMVSDLLFWADSLEHRWNLWVVGYDGQLQSGVLKNLLGEVTSARVGAAILIGGGATVGLVALSLFWRRRPLRRHPVEKLFGRFCEALAGYGWQRAPAESPGVFLTRVAEQGGLSREQTEPVIAEINRLLYNPGTDWDGRDLRHLRVQLSRLRFHLAFSNAR